MSQESRRDRVSATTRGPHRSEELYVLQDDLGGIFDVVPVAMVKELAQEFDRRLSSVDLKCRHIHVVDEDDRLLAHGWPEEALATLVHSRHNDELWEQMLSTA